MKKKKYFWLWLAACLCTVSAAAADAGGAGNGQQTGENGTAKPFYLPCGLLVVNVNQVDEVPRLSFVFLSGDTGWKLRGYGLSPLNRKAVRTARTGRRSKVAVSQEIPTASPAVLWHEKSGLKIGLFLFYYSWLVFILLALIFLALRRRKWKVPLILALCGLALWIAPELVMNSIKSNSLVIVVDNALRETIQLRIDSRHQFAIKPRSQMLLALKEGRRVVELQETGDYVKATCVLDAVKVRDSAGKPAVGFYIFNVHARNRYRVNWN